MLVVHAEYSRNIPCMHVCTYVMQAAYIRIVDGTSILRNVGFLNPISFFILSTNLRKRKKPKKLEESYKYNLILDKTNFLVNQWPVSHFFIPRTRKTAYIC